MDKIGKPWDVSNRVIIYVLRFVLYDGRAKRDA
jgi:hypothetical protein